MKILGIRLAPKLARYAIIESDGTTFNLLNADSESRLMFPAEITESAEKVYWLFRELERIFHEHSDIKKVCIKTNEYTQKDTKAKRETAYLERETAYLESVVLLYCQQNATPVTTKIYASLATKSSEVKANAESRVGRTTKYWDAKIADAIVAAWKGARS